MSFTTMRFGAGGVNEIIERLATYVQCSPLDKRKYGDDTTKSDVERGRGRWGLRRQVASQVTHASRPMAQRW